LRIAATSPFASNHLAPLLTRFLREFTDIQVDLTVTDTLVDVVSDGFDVAFWVGALPNSTLNIRTLAPYRRIVVAAPEYLDGKTAPACPDDLRQHDCLDSSVSPHSPSSVWHFARGSSTYDVPITGRLRISDERVLVDAALAGAGVLLGCRSLLREPVRDGRLVRLLPDYDVATLPITVLFQGQPDMPKKVRRFIDWIVIESEERSRRNRLADAI
jgi:DNA-binding transcriptional LysR family regulator